MLSKNGGKEAQNITFTGETDRQIDYRQIDRQIDDIEGEKGKERKDHEKGYCIEMSMYSCKHQGKIPICIYMYIYIYIHISLYIDI